MLTFTDYHHIEHREPRAGNLLSARLAAVFERHVRALAGLPRWSEYRNRYARAAGYLLARAAR